MNLRQVAVHNHIKDFLTSDHLIGRVLDVPIRADHSNSKVAHSISVRHGTGIRQNHKRNIRAGDQPGLSCKRDKEQGISDSQLFRTAVQFLNLFDEHFLIRILRKNEHHRVATHITQPPYLAVYTAPQKFRRRPRDRRTGKSPFRFQCLTFGAQRKRRKPRSKKPDPEAIHTFMMSTSLVSTWESTSLTNLSVNFWISCSRW